MTDMIYFSPCNSEIPRIVAAKLKRQLKNKIGFNDCGGKPRISGDLRIVDRSFRHLRYAEVRDGCLILYRYVGNNRVWDFRIPLYNLNINLDSPKHYCQFSLSKFAEIAPIATFQVVKEQTYKKWLKCLAVEVIRQTPLNTLKFMDILFINELLEKRQDKFKAKPKSQPQVAFHESDHANATNDAASQPPANHHLRADVNYSNGESDSLDDIRKPSDDRYQIYNNFDDGESDSSNIPTSAEPADDSSHDLGTPQYHSFRRCDSFDKHNKLNYSLDSGYCSLQSGYSKSEMSESETENNHVKVKPFEELFKKFEYQEMKPIKAKIKTSNCASSRFNFFTKFRRSNSTEESDKTNQSSILEGIRAMSPNGDDSPVDERGHHNVSNDKENRLPNIHSYNRDDIKTENNLPQSIKTTGKLIDPFSSTFHSKTEYYRNFKPQASSQAYTIEDKFHSTGNNLKEKSNSQSNASQFHSSDLERVKTRQNSRINIPDVLKDLPDTFPRTKRKPSVSFNLPEEILQNGNANVLVRLITKCQIDKEYVPVREKRILFESLSRFSFSVDNLRKRVKSEVPAKEPFLKYRSLSDLNKSQVPVSVRKTYFESFNEKEEK